MTFTLNLTEAELETISSALADYRDYADEATDPEDLIGGTPVLERINSIDDKIDEAFAKQ
tara:strand:+ start:431 stop:610 length:180 start_codon:yes stop_codon:yes gene_type:complete